MTARLEFHPEAQRELDDAVAFYDLVRPGLGSDFIDEVERATQRILAHPRSAPVARGITHRALVPRFPYTVLYVTIVDGVRVTALAHSRRRPFYWSART